MKERRVAGEQDPDRTRAGRRQSADGRTRRADRRARGRALLRQDLLLRAGDGAAPGGLGRRTTRDLNLSEIARIWKGGCIIRAELLDPIRAGLQRATRRSTTCCSRRTSPRRSTTAQAAGREVVDRSPRAHGIPVPGPERRRSTTSTATGQERLPANLIQGQRDYFGAHTYQRLDKPGTFHTDLDAGRHAEHVASEESTARLGRGAGEGDARREGAAPSAPERRRPPRADRADEADRR